MPLLLKSEEENFQIFHTINELNTELEQARAFPVLFVALAAKPHLAFEATHTPSVVLVGDSSRARRALLLER